MKYPRLVYPRITQYFLQPDVVQKGIFAISALMNIASWVMLAMGAPQTDLPFIIHYNVFFGRDFLGTRAILFSAPLMGSVVIVVNYILWRLITGIPRDFLRWLITGSTLALQIVVLIASRIAILINT